MPAIFKPIEDKDFETIKSIYDYYILNSTATFHTEPVSIEELKGSILVNHPLYYSYKVEYEGKVVGFFYLNAYKNRQAYKRSAEFTLYLLPEFTSKGIGQQILSFGEEQARTVGLKNLLAVICAENTASISLFKKNNYFECAHFKNIGEKFERVLDVVIYQKEL